ncbi:hypothetical protein QQS21_010597 [Conoideocrella luteorostrata]|uniref:TauD/TfdA-like domain-containing protein n=1 Tax=Conoideocrella luteorostrata TaxID=1105319 RepID=A0AAJ0CHE5_9HYPO|nr:hypothetical protein QQS21_010597 [Conoideocrella luteorostrata]
MAPAGKTSSDLLGPPGQPDIAYVPDLENYQARSRRRHYDEQLDKTLPPGFPNRVSSKLAWKGATVHEEYNWAYHLTLADVEEVEAALAHFRSLGQPSAIGDVSQVTFPLPTLHTVLRGISNDIHNGHGFKVVRGLPVQFHSREENIIIFAGISARIAPIRGRQDNIYRGEPADVMILHIKDLTNTKDAHTIRAPAFTSEKQVFHTDSGDVVSLFALEAATKGGQSKLASSWSIYNELAATRPDMIRTLAEPWPVDDFRKTDKGYHLRPLLFHQPRADTSPQRIIIQFARRVFTGYWTRPRSADIPPITEAQAEALDALHFLAERYALSLDFQPGDIQYVNNLSIVHARDEYTDSPDKQRHLIRMWLRDPDLAWPTPEALIKGWTRIYDNIRPDKSVFPLEPFMREPSSGTVQH